MSDKEINIAIAKARGWTDTDIVNQGGKLMYGQTEVPDFCNDLNAMHEVEKTCLTTIPLVTDYGIRLVNILHGEHKKNPRIEDTSWRIPVVGNCGWFATARQRAEAFLRTVGKWKEAAK